MTWTTEQDAALMAKWRRENAEFAAWSAGVQSGNIPLEGPEAAAEQAGLHAGVLDLDDHARRTATEAYSARQLVAWAIGYGEGRAAPGRPRVAAPDAPFAGPRPPVKRAGGGNSHGKHA